ncbi:MAG: hypothetical protein CM1200mP33_2940 [Chloroflexota bacterium]|nr:MAG: hypothetical protein CM1200mP33_2940 [Chloroflexota bacterium]
MAWSIWIKLKALSISFFLFYKKLLIHIKNSIYNLEFNNLEQRIKNVLTNGLAKKKVLKRFSVKQDVSGNLGM